jgi:cytochrome c553
MLALAALVGGPAGADSIDDSLFAPEEKCGYCHGADGNSVMARFPRLGGQNFEYLLKQLRDFRGGTRRNDDGVMKTNAEQLADADIARVARHFSEQEPALYNPRRDASPGAVLYWQGRGTVPACAQCHGAGNAQRPQLGGQHAAYLEKQLRDLRAGKRANDPDGMMQAVASGLTDADIDALTRYLSSAPAADAAASTLRGN